uniref:Uncharacterized protein n=2 Tax=Avena sativa TaxID=4498 RepID=A0ACD5Y4D1_AVESA
MDAYEATKVVFARVQALDPELASKIMGMLLIQDKSEEDMIRLAFGPEHLLLAVVARARADLLAAAHQKKASSPPAAPWANSEDAPFAGDQARFDGGGGGGEGFYPPEEFGCWSPVGGGQHRRSFSLSDAEAAAGGWKPCMYYARGFCKNGSSCRFVHGLPDHLSEQDMEVWTAAVRSELMASAFPFSPSPRGLNFLLQQQQQQQSDSQRAAAAAAMLLGGGGDDMHKFSVRSPRLVDRGGDLASNPAARQIYLTFPADSTFSEEDVSNYFSFFGPVQDVRIPYQQKRMFGFVTFVYAETVRLILAKGNPHFVCDARVLVKPYKEKGKVPDRFRKFQPPHHGDFPVCTTPTGLLDSRDPFDLQSPQIGPRMMYGNIGSHEAFLRRKLEEQQQAAELQQAIELQGRRFMGLHLLDLKSRGHHHQLNSPVGPRQHTDGNGNAIHLENATIQDHKMSSGGHAMMTSAAPAAISAIATEGNPQEEEGDGSAKQGVNSGEDEKTGPPGAAAAAAITKQESGVEEHNLPDSPFASPTKAIGAAVAPAQPAHAGNNSSPHLVASSLFPPTPPTLELPPYKSCFFQVPRFSPGHGAIGL